MSNIKAIDPDKAWGLFVGWAMARLRDEPPGTVLTLVDYPARRRRGAWLYPLAFLQARHHKVGSFHQGFWTIDGQTMTTFQMLDLINQHRRGEGQPEVDLEDLKGLGL